MNERGPVFCTECGSEVDASWKYCSACGGEVPCLSRRELEAWEETDDVAAREVDAGEVKQPGAEVRTGSADDPPLVGPGNQRQGLMGITKAELLQAAGAAHVPRQMDPRLFMVNVPDKKLRAAIKAYGQGMVEGESVIVLFDESLMGSGKSGFFMSELALYHSLDKRGARIPLAEIRTIDVEIGVLKKILRVNGRKVGTLAQGTKWEFACFSLFIEAITGRPSRVDRQLRAKLIERERAEAADEPWGAWGKLGAVAADLAHGVVRSEMVCPHCQVAGRVRSRKVERKKGVSGGKLTGTILTGGLSLLLTGLSRKEQVTQAHCDNCGSTWDF